MSAPGGAQEPGLDLQALLSSTQSAIARERGPLAWLRSRPTAFRRVVGIGLALIVPLAVALGRPRADLALQPAFLLAALVVLQALLLSLAVSLRLSNLAKPSLLRDRSAVLIGLCVVAAALPALLTGQPLHPASFGGTGQQFWPAARGCFLMGSALGLAVMGLVLAVDRAPGWQRLTLALLVGMSGLLALQLHCPLADPGHLWVGHAGILFAALAVAGFSAVLRRARA